METMQDNWNLLNEYTRKGYQSLVQLGELNARTMQQLASHQMDAMNLFLENGARQSELVTQAKDLNGLFAAEKELSREFGGRLMGVFRENLELADEAQNSYRAWFEKGLADAAEKTAGMAR